MKKILLAMTALSAVAVAAPAAAQYGNQASVYGGGNANVSNRIMQLETRLQAGIRSGAIDRREAMTLRAQLRELRRLERQYSRDGLSMQERTDLQQRIRSFRQAIRLADGGGNGRWNDDDDDRYGRSGRSDANRNGYDDRDHDRDDRWDDDRYGRSGRIDANRDGYDDRDYNRNGRWDDDQQPTQRGGIGGLVDRVFGGGTTGLRVGQRISGNLGSVPYEYRYQYRDGNGVYYRSDGRLIYEIDARTNTVVRAYPMNR